MQLRIRHLALVAVATLALATCGKKAEPPATLPAPEPAPPVAASAPAPAPAGIAVAAVTLGKAVGADKKVSAATEAFAKTDTIHASVDTTGAGTATLMAQWRYTKGNQTVPVGEETATITPTGPATTEFNINNAKGWPAGNYQVEILVDGNSAVTKSFTVQ